HRGEEACNLLQHREDLVRAGVREGARVRDGVEQARDRAAVARRDLRLDVDGCEPPKIETGCELKSSPASEICSCACRRLAPPRFERLTPGATASVSVIGLCVSPLALTWKLETSRALAASGAPPFCSCSARLP